MGDGVKEQSQGELGLAPDAASIAWQRFLPIVAQVGILGLGISAIASAIGNWRDTAVFSITHWDVIETLALSYASIPVVGVVVALTVIASATSVRPPTRVYLVASGYAAAAVLTNIAGVVAAAVDHSRIAGSSWHEIVVLIIAAIFAATACAAGTFAFNSARAAHA